MNSWRRLALSPQSWLLVVCIGILALAAFFRLEQPEALDLAGDEASALNQAYDIAHGEMRLVALHSGSVIPHPPVYLYTIAPVFLFTDDLRIAAIYHGLLGVAAVGLCGWLMKRYFNTRAAVLAMLLFAIAPWAVIAARRVPIELLPLYTLVLMAGVFEIRVRREPWGWALVGLGLALCLGTHLSSAGLLIVVALLLIPAWRTLRLKPALIGLAPNLIVGGAYLFYQAQIDFGDFRRLLGQGTTSSGPTLDPLLKLQFPLWLSGGWHISDLTGAAYPLWAAAVPEWTNVIHMAQALFLIGATVWIGLRLLRGVRPSSAENEAAIVLLTWLLAPIVLYGLLPQTAYMHYYLLLYPAPFMIMALALDRLWVSGRWRIVAGTGLTIVLAWQALTFQHFLTLVSTRSTEPGGYAEPIRAGLQAAAFAREAVAMGAMSEVILVVQGADPEVDGEAGALRALTLGLTQRYVDPSQAMILRGEPSQYLFAPGRDDGFDWVRPYLVDPARIETVPLRDGRSAYTYVAVTGAFVRDTLPEVQWALWESGARLIGYRATVDGDTVSVVTMWSVTSVPAYDVHWFHHLYAGDQKIAQVDIGGVGVSSWRVGDVLLNHALIPLPADAPASPYTLHLGSYTYPELRRLSILDGAGLPSADEWTAPVP